MSAYLNDCLLVQYADDTQFLHTGTVAELNTLIRNAQHTLDTARKYFLENGLKLNTKKTQCIFIGTRQLIPKIPVNTTLTFHNTIIKPSCQVKNLGVHFDNYMTFDVHTNVISKKVMGTLMYINRVKHYFDQPTRELIIQSLIMSILNYCNTIWGTTHNTLLSKIQKMQNFAIKVTDGRARKYDHVTPLFEKLQWLTIKKQITFNTAITMFKLKANYYPHPVVNLQTVTSVTGSTTRQHNCLYVARVHTHSGGRALAVLGPSLWNLLPQHVRESPTLHSFKRHLKKYLLTNEELCT